MVAGYREGFDSTNVVIKQENVKFLGLNLLISTVDLGLSHGIGYEGKDLYWETMVFHRRTNDIDFTNLVGLTNRYVSKEDAIEGHKEIKNMLKRSNLNKELLDDMKYNLTKGQYKYLKKVYKKMK